MSRLAVVTAVAAVVVTMGWGAGGACPGGSECADARASVAAAAPRQPFLGVVYGEPTRNTAATLARFDPLSLSPVSPTLVVGEYHRAWSLSPDGSQVALGMSSGVSFVSPPRSLRGRIGVVVVDLRTMKVVREVETGIAAEALGWLAPRRLVAVLQGGGTILADPRSGEIVRRWRGYSGPLAWARARARDRLVVLFRGAYQQAPAGDRGSFGLRLAVADGRTLRLRSVSLGPVTIGGTSDGFSDDAPGLAVDPGGARAYVTAAGSPVAEIDLTTMRVSYHRLDFLSAHEGALFHERDAVWIGQDRLVVTGVDVVARAGGRTAHVPAGAALVDTASWRSQTFDRTASGAALAEGVLVVHGTQRHPGAETGIRGYAGDGRRVFHLLKGQRILGVRVVSNLAYVRLPGAVRVVDIGRRTVVGTTPGRDLVSVIR